MYTCDVCGKQWLGADRQIPRSRCYSCETSEVYWRDRIAEEISAAFSSEADLITAEFLQRVVDAIREPGPPAIPNLQPRQAPSQALMTSAYLMIEDDDGIIEAEIVEVTLGPGEAQ